MAESRYVRLSYTFNVSLTGGRYKILIEIILGLQAKAHKSPISYDR